MVMGMAKRDFITKDFALYVVHYFASMQTWSKQDILSEIDRTIKEAKPEDAVRVVRCKDCKWGSTPYGDEHDDYTECTNIHGRPLFHNYGFCSYGERRTDED
jgi:hypothetical protein